MPSGFAVLGAISASWGFLKDLAAFLKDIHDAKTNIPEILLRFENDFNLLSSLHGFFTEEKLRVLDQDNVEHLTRVFSYLSLIAQDAYVRALKYQRVTVWNEVQWAVLGKDLKSSEEKIFQWIQRLQTCFVWFPHQTRRQLVSAVDPSIGAMRAVTAQQQMEDKIRFFRELGARQMSTWNTTLKLPLVKARKIDVSRTPHITEVDHRMRLVELRRIPASMASNVDFQEETEEEAMKLATVLGSVVPDEMFLLRAACYVESCDPRTQEPIPAVPFGIAYDLPKGYCKPKQLTQLWEMVDGTKVKHPLNERFELARQISTAVLFIHSVGWFHKGIRSSNIWLAQKDSSGRCFPQCLGTAFLAGLDYSRRGQATSTGDETGESWRRTIYQHPERASEAEASDCTAAPYRAEYDIYSLGVVLVELGRWKPVTSYDTMFKNVQAAKRKTNLESLADSLAITLGQRYVDVTLQCLRVLDSTSSSHISLGSPIRHAVLELEHLAAATR